MRAILQFCDETPQRDCPPGEVIMAEGSRTGALAVLIEGEIEVLKGEISVHETAEPGAVFGELSALLDIPHSATVRTKTACRIHVVENGQQFLLSNPQLAVHLSRLLAQRLYGVTTYLADIKRQFEDHKSHLSIVDEVLAALMHNQDDVFDSGSDRHPDPTI